VHSKRGRKGEKWQSKIFRSRPKKRKDEIDACDVWTGRERWRTSEKKTVDSIPALIPMEEKIP